MQQVAGFGGDRLIPDKNVDPETERKLREQHLLLTTTLREAPINGSFYRALYELTKFEQRCERRYGLVLTEADIPSPPQQEEPNLDKLGVTYAENGLPVREPLTAPVLESLKAKYVELSALLEKSWLALDKCEKVLEDSSFEEWYGVFLEYSQRNLDHSNFQVACSLRYGLSGEWWAQESIPVQTLL